jgi:hypothetical protein
MSKRLVPLDDENAKACDSRSKRQAVENRRSSEREREWVGAAFHAFGESARRQIRRRTGRTERKERRIFMVH